jgi:DNA-binding CsgD family transcriptional regulator/tetratricopeptide (TPR) repeat protein
VPARAQRPRFIGRTAELHTLTEAFGEATAGHGTTVLVGGEAGVGKSRLVAEAAGQARRRGARVLVGQCLDLEEGGLPYAPVVDVLRTLDRELTAEEGAATLAPLRALLGGDAGAQGDGDRHGGTGNGDGPPPPAANPLGQARLFELLLTVIERLVAAAPLVLVVEDLHWADRSTLDLVSLLASNTRNLPVLVVGTYRSDDVAPRHPLRSLAAELTRRGAHHVQLERLGPGDVAELLAALLGTAPPAELIASVVERSDGNPLFVEELAAALADDPEAPMPPQLRDAVITRVERMPEGAAAVLRACAVGGRQVEHDLLADELSTVPWPRATPGATGVGAAGGDGDADVVIALDRALRTCVESRLLVADRRQGGYRFHHALVHEAVLDDTLPGEAARLHAAYAGVLARRRGAVGGRSRPGDERWARLAHHWAAAGDHDAALGAAVRAGRAAEAAFAVPEAHRYLEWSVRLWDRAADPAGAAGCDRGELAARAADAASRAGAVVRALTLVDEALATPQVAADPVRAGLLHERRGWYLTRSGRGDDALAAYDLAMQLVPARPPSAARARVVQAHAHALVRAGRHEPARVEAEEAVALARRVGDVVDEGQGLHVLGLALAAEGRTDDAVGALHEAGQIAVEVGDLAEVAGAYIHLWRTLVEAGRGDELVELVLGFFADAAEPQAPSLMGSIAAAALHQLGRWDEADGLLGDAAAAQDAGGLTVVARTLVAGALAVDRGDHDRARDQLETARAWCHQVGDGRLNGLLHRALAELAVWQGRHDDAAVEVDAGLELLAHTGDPELAARIAAVGVRAEADRAEAARRTVGGAGGPARRGAAGDRAHRTARLLRRLDDLAAADQARRAPPSTETRGALLTAQAEAARREGRAHPAAWGRAVDVWDAVSFRYLAAYCRFRRAEAALAAGDEAAASGDLRRAWEATRALRAAPLAGAVQRLARRARVDIGAPAPAVPAAPGAGPALTPREGEVLALVAEGRTNRQIGEVLYISEKTASVHVSRLLAKLGASTRGEAAAAARRAGLLDDADGL